MFTIIGMLVVLGAVVGGYLMERGNLLVLLQPAELLIIGGAAAGTLLIANPLPVLMRILKGIAAPFLPSRFSRKWRYGLQTATHCGANTLSGRNTKPNWRAGVLLK